jgi:hypothetical protein
MQLLALPERSKSASIDNNIDDRDDNAMIVLLTRGAGVVETRHDTVSSSSAPAATMTARGTAF